MVRTTTADEEGCKTKAQPLGWILPSLTALAFTLSRVYGPARRDVHVHLLFLDHHHLIVHPAHILSEAEPTAGTDREQVRIWAGLGGWREVSQSLSLQLALRGAICGRSRRSRNLSGRSASTYNEEYSGTRTPRFPPTETALPDFNPHDAAAAATAFSIPTTIRTVDRIDHEL
ncbi:hypothetical protein P171DRAFT_479918 [Karstenula rhodostoma CBS 690.94]|uniref:Uncharacterized protein n=1 Tax=Karstenula rhodostoma CBS 690.94 TaxID=1392251 RepID=A0A9P4PXT2_9PLEO|nr:hypothetical protein P171DRAFT_479918 [Karstenula rhodostoma CBS 690.94]